MGRYYYCYFSSWFFLPLVVFAMQNRGQEAATHQAVLKVDNKVIKVFDLKGRPTYINTKQKRR